jgi:hypothetical protein
MKSFSPSLKTLSTPDVIYMINEINSYFFNIKLWKHGEIKNIPSFNGNPTQIFQNIVQAEDTLKQMNPLSRALGMSDYKPNISCRTKKQKNVLNKKDISHVVATLTKIKKSIERKDPDFINLNDIYLSQDIITNYFLTKTGNQKCTLIKG